MSITVPPSKAPASDDRSQPSAEALASAAFGQLLIAARCRAGLSLEDISATTKVALRHLEAMEQGAIDQLPGGVYRRAWVRSYAAAVGLSPDTAIEQFDRMSAPPRAPAEGHPPPSAPRPESSPQASARALIARDRLVQWVLPAAAVLIAAASVALLLKSGRSAPSPGSDSRVLIDESGARTGERGDGRRDIVLVPDAIPEEPIPDPRLVITSRPSGARVTVNGIGWGVTPITIRNLPPGRKLIRATKDGYLGRETSVEFGLAGSGETVRLILQRQE
jgi:hypothetical protein